MIRAALLLALFGACLATPQGYGYKKSYQCFQCEYRPPVTRSYQVPREVPYDVQVPVHTQECHDEEVLAGHHVTKVEKTVTTHFKPAYGHEGYDAPHEVVAPVHHDEGEYKPESYEHSKPVYKTVQRCIPKIEYTSETHYRTEYDTKTEVTPAGGFDPCRGPISYESAKLDGVDVWDCHDHCYIRTDGAGNVSRGCYKGEFGVDPNLNHPQTISGDTYSFCHGDYCNGA